MDDRIRVSDADRDRVTTRLRDHFAEGRLTPGELDQRVSAALNAKTFGDLRRVMTDLPGPVPGPPQEAHRPRRPGPPWIARRRGPRLLPLALLALLAALLMPGGWLLFAFIKLVLMFWLVACLAGIFAAGRFRRRMYRHWRSGYTQHGHQQVRQ
jgi:DUF1707 SHOCT-like domain